MKRIVLFIVFFAFSCSSLTAQSINENKEEVPYIEVVGIAEKGIIPDEIFISIILKERYKGKEKITIEYQETELKNALTKIGVDLNNLVVVDALAAYVRAKWTKKDVMAQKKLTLKVADAETVGRVFIELNTLDIENASITKVDHSKIEAFKKKMRIVAIKAAKIKADYLLGAIGEQTGNALVVYEIDPNTLNANQQANIHLYYENYSSAEKYKSNVIQFENIVVKSAVYVKFKIQ